MIFYVSVYTQFLLYPVRIKLFVLFDVLNPLIALRKVCVGCVNSNFVTRFLTIGLTFVTRFLTIGLT